MAMAVEAKVVAAKVVEAMAALWRWRQRTEWWKGR